MFNSNIRSKLDFRATAADKFAQKSIEIYRGFVQIYTKSKSFATKTAQPTPTSAVRNVTALSTAPPSGSSTDESKTRIVAGQLLKVVVVLNVLLVRH